MFVPVLQKLPEDFIEYPVKERECTDCIFFSVLIAGLTLLVALGWYGYFYGSPLLYMTVWDTDGNACGLSKATLGNPYIYFPKLEV